MDSQMLASLCVIGLLTLFVASLHYSLKSACEAEQARRMKPRRPVWLWENDEGSTEEDE